MPKDIEISFTIEPNPKSLPDTLLKKDNTHNGYLIIYDNPTLADCSKRFAEFKKEQGYKAETVDVSTICKPGKDNADKLKKYLVEADKKMGLRFVLLIGEPYKVKNRNPQNTGGNISMKYLYPNSNNHNTRYDPDYYDYVNRSKSAFNIPSDLYYETGIDWDFDKDGYSGELGEDIAFRASQNIGKNEYISKPLFAVGRIPFNEKEIVEKILENTQIYEKEKEQEHLKNPDAKPRALISSAITAYPLDHNINKTKYDGDENAETLKRNLIRNGFTVTTMYEKNGVMPSDIQCDFDLSTENYAKVWNRGCDFIYNYAHSGEAAMIWTEDKNNNKICEEEEEMYELYFDENRLLKLNGFIYANGCSTSIIECNRIKRGDTIQVWDCLKSGLIVAGVGSSRFKEGTPEIKPLEATNFFFINKDTKSTYGELFLESQIRAFSANFHSEKGVYEILLGIYMDNYFGDPSLR